MTAPAVEALISDLDDTLADSFRIRSQCVMEVARRFFNRILTVEDVRKYWGLPFPQFMAKAYATDAPYEEVAALHFQVAAEYPLRLIEGTRAALDLLLPVIPVGILTASNNDIVTNDFPQLGLREADFLMVQTSNHTEYHKPDPRVFNPILGKLLARGIGPRQTVYIGDGFHDYRAAVGAGMQFLGVATGSVTEEQFKAEGINCVPRFADVPDVILG